MWPGLINTVSNEAGSNNCIPFEVIDFPCDNSIQAHLWQLVQKMICTSQKHVANVEHEMKKNMGACVLSSYKTDLVSDYHHCRREQYAKKCYQCHGSYPWIKPPLQESVTYSSYSASIFPLLQGVSCNTVATLLSLCSSTPINLG